jgi:hypothetical protein
VGDEDPAKDILWGSSFSGGHVLSTSAEDTKVAAVAAQRPFSDGLPSGLAMSPFVAAREVLNGLRIYLLGSVAHIVYFSSIRRIHYYVTSQNH